MANGLAQIILQTFFQTVKNDIFFQKINWDPTILHGMDAPPHEQIIGVWIIDVGCIIV